MRFMLEYPLLCDIDDGAWLRPENMVRFAQAAEAAGVSGIALTDHPAPSRKWLDHGGHETFDPFAGLCFLAAATRSMRLMTFLTVVPYRNPLLLAKSMTTVDVLSGGRATFALGTGYLRSEFAALGVDFASRNELFDEAVEVLRGVWSTDEFHYEGRHFKALGVGLKPNVIQRPHPPLWVGGNARVVRERVAAWAQGWAPLLGSPELTATSRTRAISSDEELGALIAEIKQGMAERGRDPGSLDVLARSTRGPGPDAGADEVLDSIAALGKIGVTWTSVPVPRGRFEAAVEAVTRFGDEIISRLG